MADAAELAQIERRRVVARVVQLENGAAGPFAHTAAGYKELHRHLFQDVYEWAGKTRTVNMHRQDQREDGTLRRSHYIAVRFVDQGLHTAFDQLKPALPHLKAEARKEPSQRNTRLVASVAAAHVGALNYVHPFRDGNGRAMRQRVQHLASEAGLHLDQAKLDRAKWNEGSHRINADPKDGKLLTEAIAAALVPRDRVLDRQRSAILGEPAQQAASQQNAVSAERGMRTTRQARRPRSRAHDDHDITD
ncbi:MAG: Fic family protein [Planctomycetota bacterium]